MINLKLHAELAKAAAKHFHLKPEEVELSVARDLTHGDYSTNVALRIASRWGVPPRAAAETLLAELNESKAIARYCRQVEIAGQGFINFWLKHEVLLERLSEVTKNIQHPAWKKQKILVEYSSPNIAKPMHVGHIRSTIIGQALANIYEALGAKVIRLNHLGDWGTQFGKLISAYKMWGSKKAVKRDPIGELLALYVRFHEEMKQRPELEAMGQEEFKKLEEGNRENRALWKWFRDESLRVFNAMYKRLEVSFTHVTGESFYEPILKGVISDLLRRKLATRNSDGSVIVHLEHEGLPPALIQKSDGASLYATRDLAAIRYRVKHFKPSQILYVVGNEQALHFEQVFAVAKQAGYASRVNLTHIKFGALLGQDGQKFATREGRLIKLEEVLAEAVTRARAVVDEKASKLQAKVKLHVSEVVGVGALKYNDLSQNRHTDITFNWDRMLAFDGNSGPYLQYTYVRMKSILRKVFGKKSVKITVSPEVLVELTPSDVRMLRVLAQYPDMLLKAARENGPHLLAGYLYELAESTNSFYHDSPVLGSGPILRAFRLRVVESAAQVLQQGLGILGIKTVEQM